jgi:hypothetical protein
MSKKQQSAELRAKAAKHRAVARESNDSETAAERFAQAGKLEKQARDIERGR